jgi:copper chaperone CopZ
MNILVFKTNIEDVKQVRKVSPHLRNVQGILKWNVDLHDCDKILRIETNDLSPHSIQEIIKNAGYYCAELEG